MSELPLRVELRGHSPYGAPTDEVPVRLNVNENPYAPSPGVVADITAAVADALVGINRYPDREVTGLRAALAGYLGGEIHVDQVWAANGSNEIMAQLLCAFGGPHRTVLSFAPTYSMYPVYARDSSTRYVTVPRDEDHRVMLDDLPDVMSEHQPTIVLIASPNNPTGTPLSHDEVKALHTAVARTGVLVVDEAYAEFSDEASAVALVPDLTRLVVTRTLSKAFGMAGLRIGYAVAAPEIVDALRLVRLPYHLSSIDQAAATAALRHVPELMAPVAQVRTERERQRTWLQEQGITVAPSQGNFLFVGPIADSHRVFRDLLGHGVLVRETSVPGHVRVSIGTPEENEAFRRAWGLVVDHGDREGPA